MRRPKINCMSFTDKLVLWLHIGFAIFTIGPVALAISSTPRYIRKRDVAILRYLSRITVIFTAAALLVFIFGVVLGQVDHDFGHAWLTVAMTLFVVAIVLLVLVIRDQRRAIKALAPAEMSPDAAAPDGGASQGAASPGGPASAQAGAEAAGAGQPAGEAAVAAHVASVERGRIAAMGGVVNLIWLVILVLMVWQP
jgi:hypothetical protein